MKYSYLGFLQQLVFSNTQTALLHETAGYIIAQETSGAPPPVIAKANARLLHCRSPPLFSSLPFK